MKKGHPMYGCPFVVERVSAAVADGRGDRAHGGPLLNVVDPLVMIDVGARGCGQPEQGGGESGGDDAGNAELLHARVNDACRRFIPPAAVRARRVAPARSPASAWSAPGPARRPSIPRCGRTGGR